MAGEQDRLMTTEEVAEYLQMSEEFVTRAAREGQIPCLRLGIKWRFRRESVAEYVKSLETSSSAAIESSTHADSSELRKAS